MTLKSKLLVGMLCVTCLINGKVCAQKSRTVSVIPSQRLSNFAEIDTNEFVFKYSKIRRFDDFLSATNFIKEHYRNIIKSKSMFKGISVRGKKLIEAKIVPIEIETAEGEINSYFQVVTSHYVHI